MDDKERKVTITHGQLQSLGWVHIRVQYQTELHKSTDHIRSREKFINPRSLHQGPSPRPHFSNNCDYPRSRKYSQFDKSIFKFTFNLEPTSKVHAGVLIRPQDSWTQTLMYIHHTCRFTSQGLRPKKLRNRAILLVKSRLLDPRSLRYGPGPRYKTHGVALIWVTPLSYLVGCHSTTYFPQFEKPIFKLGSKFESKNQDH